MKTQQFTNTIPFLRSPDHDWKQATGSPQSKSFDGGQPAHTYSAGFIGKTSNSVNGSKVNLALNRRRVKEMRRENGWDSYIKPISKYN